MKTDPGFELTRAVMSTADAFLRESTRLFRPLGLSGAQYNVLSILSVHPDGLSQRALGDRLLVDRSNVTGLLDRMERAGWVRRADHPRDRRVYLILLTPAGRALWAKAQPLYLEVVAQMTRGLTVKRMTECRETLTQLEAAAGTWSLSDRARKP